MDEIEKLILHLLNHESSSIKLLENQVQEIIKATELCLSSDGRVIITGLGKSGIAGRKIAATFTSLGMPAVFLHPTEALHGELGILSPNDVTICISKSGETEEIIELVAHFKRWGLPIIAITANKNSSLAKNANVVILLPTADEGEPLNIIPTTSIICSIAIGDAIASTFVHIKGITREQFGVYHPGGSLGHKLTKVSELMHTGDEIPVVSPDATLRDAIVEISKKRLGSTLIMDKEHLCGILTDGDVRRAVQRTDIKDKDKLNENVMIFASKNPKTISPSSLAEEALQQMETQKITCLVVMDNNKVVGILHLHDVLRRKVA